MNSGMVTHWALACWYYTARFVFLTCDVKWPLPAISGWKELRGNKHYWEFGNSDKEAVNSALRDEIRAPYCGSKEQTKLVAKVQIGLKIIPWFRVGFLIIEKRGRKRGGVVRAIDCSVWKPTSNNNIAPVNGCYSLFLYYDWGYCLRILIRLVFFHQKLVPELYQDEL